MWESRFGASSVELGLADSATVQESSCSLRPPDGHSHHHSSCPSNTEAKCQLRTAGNYANVRTPKPPPRLPALRRRHASSHKCLSLQLPDKHSTRDYQHPEDKNNTKCTSY